MGTGAAGKKIETQVPGQLGKNWNTHTGTTRKKHEWANETTDGIHGPD